MPPPCHPDQRLRSRDRIRRRPEFRRVYERGTRVSGRFVTVFAIANGLDISRLGIAATRRIGRAVRRNRAKRLIREVFRRHRPEAGLDIVIVARRELVDAALESLEADYCSALRRQRSRSTGRTRG